jgi:hypothetical protein
MNDDRILQSIDFLYDISVIDYQDLTRAFHHYFEMRCSTWTGIKHIKFVQSSDGAIQIV